VREEKLGEGVLYLYKNIKKRGGGGGHDDIKDKLV
jgi:hypothetical protein